MKCNSKSFVFTSSYANKQKIEYKIIFSIREQFLIPLKKAGMKLSISDFLEHWCVLVENANKILSLTRVLYLVNGVKSAIRKSQHWNLGIGIGIGNGIGIGTDITNAIISGSIKPMDPKLSRMVTVMRAPHPQSHVTLGYCGHVANKTRYISTFTRPMDPKFSSVVT